MTHEIQMSVSVNKVLLEHLFIHSRVMSMAATGLQG